MLTLLVTSSMNFPARKLWFSLYIIFLFIYLFIYLFFCTIDDVSHEFPKPLVCFIGCCFPLLCTKLHIRFDKAFLVKLISSFQCDFNPQFRQKWQVLVVGYILRLGSEGADHLLLWSGWIRLTEKFGPCFFLSFR